MGCCGQITGLRWAPGPAAERVEAVLLGWLGTPCLPGRRVRGVGVDCVQLAAAVYDELEGRTTPTPVKRLPPATSIHRPRLAAEVAAYLVRAYKMRQVREGQPVEAGDVLQVRLLNSKAAGHLAIVGGRPLSAYHAGARVVCRTSIEALAVVRVWRSTERQTWSRP